MIYLENLDTLESCLKAPYCRIFAKEKHDSDGIYWSIIAIVGDNSKDSAKNRITICNVDTLEEASIWCDMHSIKIESIERLSNGRKH